MSEEKMTAREWAAINAEAMAQRNKEILNEMLTRIEGQQKPEYPEKLREHWRRVFAASSLGSGVTCETAVEEADRMVSLLFPKQ